MKPVPNKKKLVSDYVGIHWTKNGCTSQINFPSVRGKTKQNKSWKHHQEPSRVFLFVEEINFTTVTSGRGWRIIHVGDVSLIVQQEDGLTKTWMIWEDTLEVRCLSPRSNGDDVFSIDFVEFNSTNFWKMPRISDVQDLPSGWCLEKIFQKKKSCNKFI